MYDPAAINEEFQYSFQQLYSCELKATNPDLDSPFDGLNLPQLTEKQMNLFDSPITLNELYDALKQMKRSKSPGLDGISYGAFSYLYLSLTGYIPASHQRSRLS